MNSRKRSLVIALLMGIILMAVWTICFLRVNRAYPQAELIQVGLNEPLQYGPYTITANAAYIEDTITLYHENGLSVEDKALPEKTLVCSVTIERSDSNSIDPVQADLKLSYVTAVSGAWRNLIDTGELYSVLNKGTVKLNELQHGEKQTYFLTFGLWKDSFSLRSWTHLDKKTFSLQLSIYPRKNEVTFMPNP